ncbi:MAG: twin-arginine translocase subunit TatB [Gammaproteobacteria bacterium]|nr:twin-arginine translocase subunit TatB [Gammaproteobacteria bacterium]
MFDIGFTEMMLIGIVALVVIGPERLPGVARTAGKYVGRLKRFMTTVKADVEQELRADELREILSQQQKELDSLKDTISDAGKTIEKEINVMDTASEEPAVAEQQATTESAESAVSTSTAAPAAEKPASKAKASKPKAKAAKAKTAKAKTSKAKT